MLRHTVFALLLIGAAFAGGAAINGPGLIWLQRTVLGGPSIIVVDKPPAAQAPASAKPKQFPTAQAAPLDVELPSVSGPKPKAPAKEAGPVVAAEPASPPELPSTPTPTPAPEPVMARPSELPSPDLGPSPSPLMVEQPPSDLGTSPKADAVARLASVDPPPGPASASAPDWAEIRKRMRLLGITRYSMEAETDGQVRFSCVIPVEGLRAVSQQFEAEGDDELQAAEAALRRVTLWKATEAK
ncbi:hypothetical protein P12x_005782 [Tundrisphaera lichenicola]|uniref:hypothetical protein n=1 Tax=Tundrisphaera lichenicola TaxID=2029860 RepID=UPI003EBD37A9